MTNKQTTQTKQTNKQTKQTHQPTSNCPTVWDQAESIFHASRSQPQPAGSIDSLTMSLPRAADAVAADVRGRMRELCQATSTFVDSNISFEQGVRATMDKFLETNRIFAARIACLGLDLELAAHRALDISSSAHVEERVPQDLFSRRATLMQVLCRHCLQDEDARDDDGARGRRLKLHVPVPDVPMDDDSDESDPYAHVAVPPPPPSSASTCRDLGGDFDGADHLPRIIFLDAPDFRFCSRPGGGQVSRLAPGVVYMSTRYKGTVYHSGRNCPKNSGTHMVGRQLIDCMLSEFRRCQCCEDADTAVWRRQFRLSARGVKRPSEGRGPVPLGRWQPRLSERAGARIEICNDVFKMKGPVAWTPRGLLMLMDLSDSA